MMALQQSSQPISTSSSTSRASRFTSRLKAVKVRVIRSPRRRRAECGSEDSAALGVAEAVEGEGGAAATWDRGRGGVAGDLTVRGKVALCRGDTAAVAGGEWEACGAAVRMGEGEWPFLCTTIGWMTLLPLLLPPSALLCWAERRESRDTDIAAREGGEGERREVMCQHCVW